MKPQTYPRLVFFRFGFDIRLVYFSVTFNICKMVYFERVTSIEREAVHRCQSESSLIGGPKFDKEVSKK